VFATGEPSHPVAGGACAIGLTAHQLAFHPSRLRQPMRRVAGEAPKPVSAEAATAVVIAALADARRRGMGVAVLDQRPGRALSLTYRKWMAAVPGGHYLLPSGEGATLEALGSMLGILGPLGIDLERTGTLLAFGAPVLEGWGQPGRMAARRQSLRVVSVDSWGSPSASLADEFVPLRPGSEGVLALGLARVLLHQGGDESKLDAATRAKIEPFVPRLVEARTGVEARRVEALARSLLARPPVVAIGGGDAARGPLRRPDEQAIALLNIVLGSVGVPGGIRLRGTVPHVEGGPLPEPRRLEALPNGSLRVLLLDAADGGRALPWSGVEPKLSPDALVVSLSPFDSGLSAGAQVLLPAPAPLEEFDEVQATPDAVVASFGLAAPILPPLAGTTDPSELVGRLAEASSVSLDSPRSQRDLLKQRVAAIVGSRRGRLWVASDQGYETIPRGSVEEVWDHLAAGGRWVDDAETGGDVLRLSLATPPLLPSPEEAGRGEGEGLALLLLGPRGTVGGTPLAPVLSKLYQESSLRPAPGVAGLDPATARSQGLAEGSEVRLENGRGAIRARIRLDAAVPAGCVTLAAGTGPLLQVCCPGPGESGPLRLTEPDAEGVWNQTRVNLRKA
jgi:hypothetical protein